VGERRRSASIAVRPELQDRYNAELQERSWSAVWLTGCRSWYLDASGNNRALWPGSTVAFRRRTKLWGGKRPSEFRPHARRQGAGRLAPASRPQDPALGEGA